MNHLVRATLFAVLLPLSCHAAVPTVQVEEAALPPLQALISYVTLEVSPDGITQQHSYKERWIRDGDMLWSERLIPLPVARAFHLQHAAHAAQPRLLADQRRTDRAEASAIRLASAVVTAPSRKARPAPCESTS